MTMSNQRIALVSIDHKVCNTKHSQNNEWATISRNHLFVFFIFQNIISQTVPLNYEYLRREIAIRYVLKENRWVYFAWRCIKCKLLAWGWRCQSTFNYNCSGNSFAILCTVFFSLFCCCYFFLFFFRLFHLFRMGQENMCTDVHGDGDRDLIYVAEI